jgi:Porin PorA
MVRRMLGPILIGSGVFLLVLAWALPFVVYPKMAILPIDPQASQTVKGDGFDVLLPRNVDDGGTHNFYNVSVTSKVFVTEDTRNGKLPADSPNAFWSVSTRTYIDGKGLLLATVEGVSLDRRTAKANNCCGDYYQTEKDDPAGVAMPHEGWVFNFPFNTQKRSYPLWDASVNKTVPAVFAGEETVRGFKAYRFEQEVPPQKTGTQDLPGELFKLDDPSVVADYIYHAHRTFWIEPNSGAIVNYQQRLDHQFDYKGARIPIIQGTLSLVPPSEDAQITKLLRQAAMGLPLLRWRLPMIFLPLGIVLLVAGIIRIRRQQQLSTDYRVDDWDDDDWDDDPVDANVSPVGRQATYH